jgi:hypothetical protein
MVSFIITPVISGIMTYFFSYLDIRIRGDQARKPIIPLPFDKDDRETEMEGSSSKVDEQSARTDEKEEEGVEVLVDDVEDDVDDDVIVDEGAESVYATGFTDNTTVFDHTTVADHDPY